MPQPILAFSRPSTRCASSTCCLGGTAIPVCLLAQRIRASHADSLYTSIGGNVPQSLVNQACLDIQQGRVDTVLIAGAETWRTRTKVRAAGGTLDWTKQDESVPAPQGADDEFQMAGPVEIKIHLDRPAYVYPMFEQALRIAAGETPDAHRRRIGELWARFSAVAARQPACMEPGTRFRARRSGSPDPAIG